MKKIIFVGVILAIATCYIFAGSSKPKPSYQDLEKKIRRLENQTRIMGEGWQQCVQDFERLMEDCRGACDGKI